MSNGINTTNPANETSVSFSRSQVPEDSEEDDIQIPLAPYIQNYLAHSGSRVGCCGLCLPVAFERAARCSWWDPRFDSDILEKQYRSSSFPQIRLRFRYALLYILIVSLSWMLYFLGTGLQGVTSSNSSIIFGTFAFLTLTIGVTLFLTYTKHYQKISLPVSIAISLLTCTLSLVFVVTTTPVDMTPVGQFALCIEILLLIYTVVPLPLYLCVFIGGIYSVMFECLTAIFNTRPCLQLVVPEAAAAELSRYDRYGLVIRIILQLCVHAIGLHVLVMTHVRMRGTFMKVGQSLLVRKQLEMEKQIKEKMIHSVMPPKVAAWLLSEGGLGDEEAVNGEGHRRGSSGDIRSLFRPFNMDAMHNVSILFADIVGFTRMSSNKSAEELVQILNDLFERFDELCVIHGCEKISTLGDCYYCVSGCPEPQPDHAKCCVEMGLGMIDAIRQFDAETHEGVNMRVGIHTGTVLCGIVGTKRFKFDVWSNDVTLANRMESTGKPGMVHISEKTKSFLNDTYILQEGEEVHGLKTFFILGRKSDPIPEVQEVQESNPSPPRTRKPRPSPLSLPSTPIRSFPPKSPTQRPLTIPQTSLFSVNLPQRRNRVFSCHARPTKSPCQLALSPLEMKANSLPSILDSDLEGDTDGLPVKKASHEKDISEKTAQSCSETANPEHATPETNGDGDVNKATETSSLIGATHLEVPNENNFIRCHSVSSRKDSGIRSNSRRSSIQQQLFVMNGMAQGDLLTHRVSGYYTSSQSSLDNEFASRDLPHVSTGDRMGFCFQQLRKQSDLQLIRCVQDNVSSHRSYFVKPPLSSITLFFRQKEMEREYRDTAHRISEKHVDSPPTLATSRYNTYFDIFISALVFSAVAMALFFLYAASPMWIAVFVTATLIQIFAVIICAFLLWTPLGTDTSSANPEEQYSTATRLLLVSNRLIQRFSGWYPWHICGAILVSLPAASVLANFSCPSLGQPFNTKGSEASGLAQGFSQASALLELSHDYYFSYVLFISLVHFCNFTQLNCWMKSMLATLTGVIFISLVASQVCSSVAVGTTLSPQTPSGISFTAGANFDRDELFGSVTIPFMTAKAKLTFPSEISSRNTRAASSPNSSFTTKPNSTNASSLNQSSLLASESTNMFNKSSDGIISLISRGLASVSGDRRRYNEKESDKKTSFSEVSHRKQRETEDCGPNQFPKTNFHHAEIYLDVILLLLLVWFLNREFEISYRLSFHGNAVAVRDKAKIQIMKDQADWLLHNIIPRHVADQLKNTAKYSENHHLVGIIFASIVNFNEMYDETYLGGKEYLRVLNELIGDFDELLSRPEFCNVTKIKTIGSTYMAASGLNPHFRSQNAYQHQHLFQLIDFAVALQGVIDSFNQDLLEFNLILRVGYNHGDITAGVIGTTKLYYDIWGDAVNIASRMDSTGVNGRIQVGEDCLPILSQKYEFEPRGSVYVKGKDNMNVYLLNGKKTNSESN